MTAVADAKTVINKILAIEVDDAKLQTVINAFALYVGDQFQPADSQNPTEEEKAQNFLDAIRKYGRDVMMSQTENAALQQAKQDIDTELVALEQAFLGQ